MSDRGIAERIAVAVAAAWRARNRHLEGHLVDERDGVVVSLSGLPDPAFSGAAVEREPGDPVGTLRWADDVFRARGAPFGIVLQRDRHASVERGVAALGLRVLTSEPAMAVDAAEVVAPPPIEGLEIRRATTTVDLEAMATLEREVFGTDPGTAAGFFGAGLLDRPGIALYLASIGGRPVSMAYTQAHAGALGVFGVATATWARGRGIAAAVTAVAVHAGRRAGADLAWLQASEMGRPVYERLGFEAVSTWDVWTRPRVHGRT